MKQNFLKNVLTGPDDMNVSSKRVIAMLLILTLITVVIANMFLGYKIDEFVFNGLSDALIWSLAFISTEQVGNLSLPGLRGKRTTDTEQITKTRKKVTIDQGDQDSEEEHEER